jgi:isopentenyl phosphate kinase
MKLLKLGGSIITKKDGWREADLGMIEKLAKIVSRAWKKSSRDWVLVHGAGSFGHPLVVKYGIDNGVRSAKQKLGFAITHEACSELNVLVTSALNTEGIPAISLRPATIITSKNKRIHSFNTKIIDDYLEAGYLPVIPGDMVPDIELGGSVCSGDQIISYLGKKAEKIILATNVDGVLDDKGKIIPRISMENIDEVTKYFKTSNTKDVTGSMAGKIRELLDLDTPSYIVNGLKMERLSALMADEKTECSEIRK